MDLRSAKFTPPVSSGSQNLAKHKAMTSGDVETMKVILLGRSNIGKTALTRRFVHNDFKETETTVS